MHKKIQQSGEIIENPYLHYQKIWTVGMLLSSNKILAMKTKNKDNSKSNFSGQSTINVNKTGAINVGAALCQR